MLLKDKGLPVKYLSVEKLEDYLNHADFPPVQEIRCMTCDRHIRLPVVARERDVKLLEETIQKINQILNDVNIYIEKHYGIDIRHAMLHELLQELINNFSVKKPS